MQVMALASLEMVSTWISAEAIGRLGENVIRDRYGNLFDMYENITGENPYEVPMRIYPAVHYTMGGLWVDYNLMSTIPGLFVIGEANFSDHGANRLGASALMQGLADGYFIVPYTIGNYLAQATLDPVDQGHDAFRAAEESGASRKSAGCWVINGERTVASFHRELGNIMWEFCGMERTAEGLQKSARADSGPARRSIGKTFESRERVQTSIRVWKWLDVSLISWS